MSDQVTSPFIFEALYVPDTRMLYKFRRFLKAGAYGAVVCARGFKKIPLRDKRRRTRLDAEGREKFAMVDTKTDYALKIVNAHETLSNTTSSSRFENEFNITHHLHHPNLIHSYVRIETALDYVALNQRGRENPKKQRREVLILVMDYFPGVELRDIINQRIVGNACISREYARETEKKMRHIFRQMLRALAYLHASGVMHRDIKAENVLIDTQRWVLKVVDLGYGKKISTDKPHYSACGTMHYAAPEILRGKNGPGYHGQEIDSWSAGVVLFVSLFRTFPFLVDRDGQTDDLAIRNAILTAPPRFPDTHYASENACALIRALLTKSAPHRLTVTDALEHPWFDGE